MRSEFYKARLGELGNEDWMEIDPNDAELLNPNSILTCLLNPGDMILWDSRTVHCSNPRSQEATNNQVINNESLLVNESAHGLLRAAAAVCMMPASNADASIFQQRRVAVDQKRTLTHWANKVALWEMKILNKLPWKVAEFNTCWIMKRQPVQR